MNITDKARLLQTSVLSTLFVSLAIPAYAQVTDTTSDESFVVEQIAEEEDEVEESGDTVVVTGSRVKRDTFSSISPLQVITTELSQDVGLFDPAAILQRSEAASGQQIDGTFQGFVLDNGPGSQTLNIRGLGADRTLLLMNGRRIAPAGVEGAPTSPSINLLPGSLIERYDLLLDGASSIYGSDAVAGVGNVILKKDFEGLEVFGSGNYNPRGGGNDYTVSAAWGKNTDRGFFGVGAEYDLRDEIRIEDRDFLAGCDRHYEITESGEIRTLGIADQLTVEDRTPGVTTSASECKVGGITGRIFIPFTNLGSVYFTDGAGNSGIPGYDESTGGFGDVDADGDGIRDVDFNLVNTNGLNPERTFIPEQKRYSLMGYGEYTLEGEANITPYFEALYSRVDISSENTGNAQVFPYVSAANEFNPCNIGTGVDCRAGQNAGGLFPTPLSTGFSLPVLPIFAVQGDRDNFDVTQEQTRFVAGVKGDVTWLNHGVLSDWEFDLSGTYSRSEGNSTRRGIREDKLAFALGIDPSADFDGDGIFDNNGDGFADDYDQNVDFGPIFGVPVLGVNTAPGVIAPCDVSALANPGALLPDVAEGCVPVNAFAPSLFEAVGDFATAAERDYVFGERTFKTVYEQTIISGILSGRVGKTAAGPIGAALGFEIRNDKINSAPSVVASNGLFFGFFSDGGAVGDKTIKELFAEVDIPLIADYPLFKSLEVNISGRYTDEEFYGSAGTYSIKSGWRPVDSLLLKASYGTSFRAPNLRENFLRSQSGFNTLGDPCAVPDDAFVNGAYDANLDTREQTTLANCIREGRDPTTVGIEPTQGLDAIQSASVEISAGGSLDLEPETSTSFTAGFAFTQPFYDSFDFDIGVNYYDIKVTDAVIEPSAAFIINDCYTRDDGVRSTFCDRITTGDPATTRGLVSDVFAGFINQDEEIVRGLDINSRFAKEFTAFEQPMEFGLNVRANKLLERSELFIDDEGNELFDDDAGEFGYPEWTGTATAYLDWDKFRFTWQTRYIDAVEQDEDGIDPFSDVFDTRDTGFVGHTCSDGVFCRDVGFADDYMTHTASVRYSADTWTVRAGVSNIFDKEPPLVDGDEVLAISNTPIGNGYDLDGREFFLSASKRF
ncbi:TonB-dependent receptor-like protein [Litorimonas taeanensis]|uniref:TonB-dependent receptor-like protein n=1 Tax=Litorimonas taeanensis TaxID=568099 RepID=A0A420WIW4_9PROT|nr:TonB-dependent receptor [Litorimonas taeanensis]RKQ70872.1 TonB-dependent receptor-like protein [Litorimonas taeanensis]